MILPSSLVSSLKKKVDMPYLRLARGVGAVTAVGHSHQANPGQSQGDGETQCLKVHSGEAPDGSSLRSQAVIARCGFTTRLNRNGLSSFSTRGYAAEVAGETWPGRGAFC